MKKLSIMAELREEIFETAKKSTMSGPQFTRGSTEFLKKNCRTLKFHLLTTTYQKLPDDISIEIF